MRFAEALKHVENWELVSRREWLGKRCVFKSDRKLVQFAELNQEEARALIAVGLNKPIDVPVVVNSGLAMAEPDGSITYGWKPGEHVMAADDWYVIEEEI